MVAGGNCSKAFSPTDFRQVFRGVMFVYDFHGFTLFVFGYYMMELTTPPSTLNAAPLVAEASGLAT